MIICTPETVGAIPAFFPWNRVRNRDDNEVVEIGSRYVDNIRKEIKEAATEGTDFFFLGMELSAKAQFKIDHDVYNTLRDAECVPVDNMRYAEDLWCGKDVCALVIPSKIGQGAYIVSVE